jgi:O-antigen ligase
MSRKNAEKKQISETETTLLEDVSTYNLMSEKLFFVLIIVSLAIPNIIFSGPFWFQTLHLMKWFTAMVPIALLSIIAGVQIFMKGPEKAGFRVDVFGWIWLFLLLYITAQPLWADLRSVPTYVREWYFFGCLWACYILCYNLFRQKWLVVLFRLASLVAVLNVIFAELQFNELQHLFPFILPTPGHYIGNTGQQNMFGFWLAISGLNCVFLHVFTGFSDDQKNSLGKKFFPAVNLVFLFIIGWGIWCSTSRSAILSLFAGLVFLLIILIRTKGKKELRRFGVALTVLIIALTTSVVLNQERMDRMLAKTIDVFRNYRTIGSRDSIWLTSWYMFKEQPVKGVGLGQYKWNYLDAQKKMLSSHPEMDWKYTYWAHSEYFQWFCEAGLIPGIILMGLALWWLWKFSRALFTKKQLSLDAVWACSMLALIWFNAMWTRPFHRIEDALWMAFAFALANRALLPVETSWTRIKRPFLFKALGLLLAICSISGLVFLGSGMAGDLKLRKGVQSENAFIQRRYLEQASEHLMVRDIAEKELAYHYLAQGSITEDPELMAEGINRLYAQFRKEPHSKELKNLLDLILKIGRRDLAEELASYLKPGSFTIRARPDGK